MKLLQPLLVASALTFVGLHPASLAQTTQDATNGQANQSETNGPIVYPAPGPETSQVDVYRGSQGNITITQPGRDAGTVERHGNQVVIDFDRPQQPSPERETTIIDHRNEPPLTPPPSPSGTGTSGDGGRR